VAKAVQHAELTERDLGINMFTFWPSFVEAQLTPTVNERHLYMCFRELLMDDFSRS
jgi:hypothetical protein